MAQVVEADLPQTSAAEQWSQAPISDVSSPERLADCISEDEVMACPNIACGKTLLRLPGSMSAERAVGRGRQWDRSLTLPRLWLGEIEGPANTSEGTADVDAFAIPVAPE